MGNKRILLLITGLGMGGAERQVCDLADQFVNDGHRVMLLSMTGDAVNRPKSTNVEVIELHMNKTPFGVIRAYNNACRLIRKFKPDIVHSHMVHANIFARLLRLNVKVPRLVCTAHSTNEGSNLRMFAYRITDKLCDISTNVSEDAVSAFIERKALRTGRMITMFNGIDCDNFSFDTKSRFLKRAELDLAETTPLLLAVGRLTAAKDYLNLLNGFLKLPDSLNHTQLVIIGVGEDELILKEFVLKNGLSNRVHFLGLRRDVHMWMSAADIFIMSSAWEGMPLVILEAMCAQRYVISTDCGGINDIAGEYVTIVPIKNSDSLSKAIENALNLPLKERIAFGARSRDFVCEHFSLPVISERWQKIYFESTDMIK
ncbi:glycosyltransferase [Aeromonas veronii]